MNVFRALVGFVVMAGYSIMLLVGVLAYFVPNKRRDNLRKGFSLPEFVGFVFFTFGLPALCGALLLDVAANQ